MQIHSQSITKTLILSFIFIIANSIARADMSNGSSQNTGQNQQTTTVTDSAGNVTSATKASIPGGQVNISVTQSKDAHAASSKASNEVNDALSTCRPFQTSIPHPMMKDFTIKMQVHGISDGKCKFTQTMPNNGLQTCSFTEQQRNEIKVGGSGALQSLMQNESVCKITGY